MSDLLLALLRDGAWQFAGVLVGLVSIVATVLVYYLQRAKPKLTAGLTRSRSLLSVPSQAAGKVTIEYDGMNVDNVHLIECLVANFGARPLLPNDFVSPLRITPSETTTILSAAIATEFPKGLSAKLTLDPTGVKLEPLLLNSGDSLTIQILASGENPGVDVSARLAGISELTPPGQGTRIKAFEVLRDLNFLLIQIFLVYSATKYILLTIGLNQNAPLSITVEIWIAMISLGTAPIFLKYLYPFRRDFLWIRRSIHDA